MSKHKLKILTKSEIQSAYEYQKNNGDWTFYSEREFIENLFSERFNYLLVAYSLIVTAFATLSNKNDKLIILSLGLVITILITFTIYRLFIKLNIILKILYKLDDSHVFPMIKKEVNAKGLGALGNVNPIIGLILPLLFISSFIVAISLIALDIWVAK